MSIYLYCIEEVCIRGCVELGPESTMGVDRGEMDPSTSSESGDYRTGCKVGALSGIFVPELLDKGELKNTFKFRM